MSPGLTRSWGLTSPFSTGGRVMFFILQGLGHVLHSPRESCFPNFDQGGGTSHPQCLCTASCCATCCRELHFGGLTLQVSHRMYVPGVQGCFPEDSHDVTPTVSLHCFLFCIAVPWCLARFLQLGGLDPCNSHGTCTDYNNNYHCDCDPGYTGTSCETASK